MGIGAFDYGADGMIDDLKAKVAELESKLESCQEALEFYADEENWTEHLVECGYMSSYGVKASDGGEKARTCPSRAMEGSDDDSSSAHEDVRLPLLRRIAYRPGRP